MTAPAKWLADSLAARGVVIRTASRVTAIAVEDGRVLMRFDHGPAVTAAGAVLTPPVPQVLDLLASGGLVERMIAGTPERLAAVSYEPCFALMLVLDRPSLVPQPGGLRFQQAGGRTAVASTGDGTAIGVPSGFPLAWIADNQLKGISQLPCLTLHATADFSRERFDAPPDEVIAVMLEAARPWIDGTTAGGIGGIVERSLHRWKYALVARGCDGPFLPILEGHPVAVCGDAFGGPRVEAAAESGLAAGRWLADRLG
jgi:renalase